MNPILLKELILAGHRVACKTKDGDRTVLLFINGRGDFDGTLLKSDIEGSLYYGVCASARTENELETEFTGEYKIVTQAPVLPKVGDTVEVLDNNERKWMHGKKYKITSLYDSLLFIDNFWFNCREVAKCEPEEEVAKCEPEEVVVEKELEVITLNGKKYREITE